MVRIENVLHGSLADKSGIKNGDILISVNGNEPSKSLGSFLFNRNDIIR